MKKHLSYKTLLLILSGIGIALIFIPIIINCSYVPDGKIKPEWGAGDLLQYLGSSLTGIATIIIAWVAINQSDNAIDQTDTANNLNDRLLKIEENRYKLELRPFFMITDYRAYAKKESDIIKNPDKTYISIASRDEGTDDILCIEMDITNTTSSFVTARFGNAITEKQNRWGHGLSNQKDDVVSLQPYETGVIVFYASPPFFKADFRGSRIRMKFILENRLAKRYAEYLTIMPNALSCGTVGCSPDGKWFIGMFIQEYAINRFDKDENGNDIEIQEEL